MRFGPLTVDWPHKNQSRASIPPKGNIIGVGHEGCGMWVCRLSRCGEPVLKCKGYGALSLLLSISDNNFPQQYQYTLLSTWIKSVCTSSANFLACIFMLKA